MRPFTAADILLPGAQADLSAWAVLACDQFTSEPDYWRRAQAVRQGKPSALDIILPECFLERQDTPARIEAIHANMRCAAHSVLQRSVHGFVYVERTTQSGVRVDYIHGEAAVRALAARGEAVGVLLPPIEKRDHQRGVAEGGVLPKKTFSMGSAEEKRYYMECRRILP